MKHRAYNITVRSEGIAWTGPISADILFSNLILLTNQLVINQGQTVIFSSANLKASNMGKEDEDLSFIISNLTHGKFAFIAEPDQPFLFFSNKILLMVLCSLFMIIRLAHRVIESL